MTNIERRSKVNRFTNLLSCRQILNIMVCLGFMLNYALRVNLTIAIVAMVEPLTPSTSESIIDNETFRNYERDHNLTALSLIAHPPLNDTLSTYENKMTTDAEPRFNWDTYQQNFVLGSFFWGYILTELPGGRLAELIGGRRVFGHSMLWASLLTLITPFAAYTHYVFLIVVRVVLGFMLGASWPAIHPMAAVWIKPMDRSKFMSNMMASSLGAAITMPICGVLISSFGWASVFYATGGVGLLWSILWFIFIFDTPATHPRITPEERNEIEEAIGSSTSKTRPSYVPWKQMLTSAAVWAIILTHGLSVFGFFTLINQLPTYMRTILQFNIKSNGLYSSLPYLGKYIMALSSSFLVDYLRQNDKLTTTQARKVFTSFALMSPGLLMILQAFYGKTAVWSITIFTLTLFTHGAVTAGYLGNGLDIAPNFSGTIFGLANTLSSFGGFLSTWMVGALTYEDKTYLAWQKVFSILAATYIGGAVIYLIFGTGELQSWNNPPERKKKHNDTDLEQQEPLKNGKI
ncbi:sialin [Condylostylus longicornis]|uniref:sialin n=1 Tax=Condylostylus longicornis TaxID=2530218 RepID=UPI00244DA0EC|nr:sialin [Condylostylus longicornis]